MRDVIWWLGVASGTCMLLVAVALAIILFLDWRGIGVRKRDE